MKKQSLFNQLFEDEHVLYLIMEYSTYEQMGKWIQVCKIFYQFVESHFIDFFSCPRLKNINECLLAIIPKDEFQQPPFSSIEFLIKKGADIHIQNNQVMKLACKWGIFNLVKDLVSKESVLNRTSKNVLIDDDSLQMIYSHSNLDMIQFLKNRHYPLSNTIFFGSIMRENFDTLKYYLDHVQVSEEDLSSGIIICIREGNLDFIKYLVSRGADLYYLHNSYFRIACENGDVNMIQYFQSQGFNSQNDINQGLKIACDGNNLPLIDYFISQGANLQYENNSIIQSACKKKNWNFIEYLISKGCDIHTDNEACLRRACIMGDLPLIKYLVSKGCNIHVNNEEPLICALSQCHDEVFTFLISQGANIESILDSVLISFCRNKALDRIEFLVSQGIDISNHLNSCLEYAHKEKNKYLESFLLSLMVVNKENKSFHE